MHCEAFKKGHSPFIFCEDGLLRSSEKWECCAMSSLMYPWPEVMVSGLKPTKVSWLALVQALIFSWMVLFQMSRKQKRKQQAGPVSGCPKFVLRAVETPFPIVYPIQSRMRQLKKGTGKKEPLVRMEAGRSRSLELVTGDQFTPGSHPVEQIAHQDHRRQLQLCLSQGVTSNHWVSNIEARGFSTFKNVHFAHLKGFSPVWMRRCFFRSPAWLKELPKWCVFSPLWMKRWWWASCAQEWVFECLLTLPARRNS